MRRVVVLSLLVTVLATVPASAGTALEPGEIGTTTPIEIRLTRFYRAVLDRQPDPAGMAYWYAKLSTGTSASTVADSFAISEEFERRFGVPRGEAGDLRFLEQVYRNVLGREPDEAGSRYWRQVLTSGAPRAHIVLWFSESEEFIERTGLRLPELPPFEARSVPVDAERLGASWRPGCPAGPADLRLVAVSHVGFDGDATTGELVVHADVVDAVIVAFERLYTARYPIQSMRTIDEFDGSDDASMDANNTSAFNCRSTVAGSTWSEHAFGRAIDINPLVNPYVRGDTVLPFGGRRFTDRDVHHAALIREGDIVTESFDAIGWDWGGRWRSVRDYQHFSLTGR